jgi:hypothetical protein
VVMVMMVMLMLLLLCHTISGYCRGGR